MDTVIAFSGLARETSSVAGMRAWGMGTSFSAGARRRSSASTTAASNSPHTSAEPVDFGAIVSLKEKVTEGIVR